MSTAAAASPPAAGTSAEKTLVPSAPTASPAVTVENPVGIEPPVEKIPPVEPPPETPMIPWPAGTRALVFLAVLAVLYTLYFARAVLVPISFGVVLSLLLRPVVRWLSRRRIPESIGAALCLLALLVTSAVAAIQLVGPVQTWIAAFPQQVKVAKQKLQGIQHQWNRVTAATDKIEELTAGDPANQPLEVEIQQPRLSSNVVLLSSTGAFAASVGLVIVLSYFLLASGDQLINNILTTMPRIREKRQVVELILNVQRGVSTYLFNVTMINLGLGIIVAVVMGLMRLPNPILWGLLSFVLNYIPYLGQLICGLLIGFVAMLTFDSPAYALLLPVVFFTLTTIEGQLVTPAVLGRQMSLNPIMVVLFLTLGGWMWGIGGAVLAVPALAILKISCDQFERTQSLGTMLSG